MAKKDRSIELLIFLIGVLLFAYLNYNEYYNSNRVIHLYVIAFLICLYWFFVFLHENEDLATVFYVVLTLVISVIAYNFYLN